MKNSYISYIASAAVLMGTSFGSAAMAQDYTWRAVTHQLPGTARFEGTVTMPADKRLSLRGNFSLPPYIDAFGDEALGFKKAFQALLNFTDHDSLDLAGRRVELDGPIDMQAAEGSLTTFEVRRVLLPLLQSFVKFLNIPILII